ncbi:MAG TPA: hypothetical protein VEC57_21070 [Candidatus Limnocylindrales bacterium]|nr:hypothetical protein [Candidatus Limnocylindrales bacterium]
MAKTYSEKLLDPRWQRKRLEILDRSGFSCESCEATDKTLHVHHKLYRKGAMPWEYSDHELEALCHECHEEKHSVRKRLDETLARLSAGEIEQVLGFALGCLALEELFPDEVEEELKNHTYQLNGWSESRGFYARLAFPVQPEELEEFMSIEPLDSRAVFEITVHGLPSKREEQ